ncbi:MAG: hypothetical protein KF861_19140 [Planctomycetaceae bacterium]|nr:hypothetical protein [Planctomycetaceae bacterium]
MRTILRPTIGALLAASLMSFVPLCQSAEPVDGYDVLFFASDGPVVLRFRLEASGVGIATVRQRYAAVLFGALDADKDKRLTAEEARLLPVGGRLAAGVETLGDRWMDLDTSPPDGALSLEELAVFLEPLLGERFAVRRKPPLLVQSVQLHPRLDLDGDGRISREEIDRAAETLRQYDFDDDGTFSPAELQPFPQSMVDAGMTTGAEGEGGDFVILPTGKALEELAARVVATYEGKQGPGIGNARLSLPEEVFKAFDVNSDGLLDAVELAALLRRPRPVAEISVDLRRRRVKLESAQRGAERVRVVPSDSNSRLTLHVGGETVDFSAVDNRYQAADQISLLRIEFRRQDGDKNGYLDAQEFAMLGNPGGTFEDVDLNGDGQVYLEELDRFIQLDAYLAQCYAEMTVDAIDKPLFQILDENLDRRLTLREFAAAVERMQPYDRNGDGLLDASELLALRKYRVAFSFGVPPAVRIDRQNQMSADRRMPVVRTVTTGPEWFRKMDRNQDDEVTWREFLGPRSAFDLLDRDGSGWIDAEEAEAAQSHLKQNVGVTAPVPESR